MTKEELYEMMTPLAESMRNSLASKQHAFNSHRAIIETCKTNGISNQLITDAINSHLNDGEKITLAYFKNLLVRSNKNSQRTKDKVSVASTSQMQARDKDESRHIQINSDQDSDALSAYMKVCFGSERIAGRAIEAGVSIDEIKSWKCPNQVNLGTRLSNHIQNK
jgi:intergrase/recombinase